jgi:hypothetical protein
VGDGNTTDVGSKTLTPESQRRSAKKCGAMSEQSADSGRGNEQVPQQLVHLVGYREPTVPLPWVRRRGA